MASEIEVTANVTTDDLSIGDVYDGMRLGGDDISKKSPITPGLREVAATIGEDTLTLRVQGHSGQWSKTSQEALTDALAEVDGVDGSTIEVEGGFKADSEVTIDPPEDDEDEDEGDENDVADVSEIDGVGELRAEALREAGIETVDDVIDIGAEGLIEAGISEGVAENIVERV